MVKDRWLLNEGGVKYKADMISCHSLCQLTACVNSKFVNSFRSIVVCMSSLLSIFPSTSHSYGALWFSQCSCGSNIRYQH